MQRRINSDVYAGLAFLAFGLVVAWYSRTHYSIGTVRQMGTGMIPYAVGFLIAGLGGLLALTCWLRGTADSVDFRPIPVLLITLAIIGFGAAVRPFGLVPAVAVIVGISSLADRSIKPVTLLFLMAALSVIAVVIFRVALGMNFAIVRWP